MGWGQDDGFRIDGARCQQTDKTYNNNDNGPVKTELSNGTVKRNCQHRTMTNRQNLQPTTNNSGTVDGTFEKSNRYRTASLGFWACSKNNSTGPSKLPTCGERRSDGKGHPLVERSPQEPQDLLPLSVVLRFGTVGHGKSFDLSIHKLTQMPLHTTQQPYKDRPMGLAFGGLA